MASNNFPSASAALFAEQYYPHHRQDPIITITPQQHKQKAQSATVQKILPLPPPDFTPSIRKNIYHNVGLLRANWYGAEDRLITFTFGTAIMLTNNIALTCTHNIYSAFRRRFADEVELLVDIEEGFVGDQYLQTYRKSIKIKNLPNAYFENFFTESGSPVDRERFNFEYQPRKQEITLLALSDQILQGWGKKKETDEELSNGLPIGNLRGAKIQGKKQLMIVGYPSETYKMQTNLQNVFVNRQTFKGHLAFFEAYCYGGTKRQEIINHTMSTSHGFSGSPILAFIDDKLSVIGMHTHRGREEGLNSGVYFDSAFLVVIREFQQRIKLKLAAAKQDFQGSIRFIEGKSPSPREDLSLISEEFGDQSEEGRVRVYSQSEQGEHSKFDNIYDLSSLSGSQLSQFSEMGDMGLLDYFTLLREEEEEPQLQLQSNCGNALIHPSLLLSDLDE